MNAQTLALARNAIRDLRRSERAKAAKVKAARAALRAEVEADYTRAFALQRLRVAG
jgi:hypothetical protein